MSADLKEMKCRLALEAIALRYRGAIGGSYQTDWGSAFPFLCDRGFDDKGARSARVRINQEEHPMTGLSKALIVPGAL